MEKMLSPSESTRVCISKLRGTEAAAATLRQEMEETQSLVDRELRIIKLLLNNVQYSNNAFCKVSIEVTPKGEVHLEDGDSLWEHLQHCEKENAGGSPLCSFFQERLLLLEQLAQIQEAVQQRQLADYLCSFEAKLEQEREQSKSSKQNQMAMKLCKLESDLMELKENVLHTMVLNAKKVELMHGKEQRIKELEEILRQEVEKEQQQREAEICKNNGQQQHEKRNNESEEEDVHGVCTADTQAEERLASVRLLMELQQQDD